MFILAACSSGGGGFDAAARYRAVTGTPLTLSGLSMVAENENFSLWADADTASFEIRSAGGTVWRSLPEHYNDTDWVIETSAANLASILSVTALDASFSRQELLCYEHCVENGTVRFEGIPDGVRFLFRYARQGITIPLDIRLTADGFTVQVAPGDIIEDGGFLVNQITLLPYFNSGTSSDDGFLFYPDGSGAISEYDKDYNNATEITQPVFGFDRGIGTVEVVSQALGYRMPVYGAKTNEAAYLAVIEGAGSFAASVNTGVPRRRNNIYSNRYFKNGVVFTYRDVGRVFLRDSETSVATSYTIPAPVTATSPLTVRYLLLEGGDIRYTDMAFAYREHLERTGVFDGRVSRDNPNSAHLTLMGALVKPSSLFGIPMQREIALTDFDQAAEIIGGMHAAGVRNMGITFKGAQTGGYNSRWTRDFRFNRALGGSKGWNGLINTPFAGFENDFYLNAELLNVYKSGRGFSASRDAARTTGGGLNFQYDYFIQDGSRDSYSRRWNLSAPSLWEDAFGRLAESGGRRYAIEDAGALVYSDYCQNDPVFRDITGPWLVESLKKLGKPALTYGNAYTWEVTDTLFDVPLGASGFFIQSDEVPFYQLVTHGHIQYSGEAMNLSADKQLSLLRSVEYGALPHYFGIYAPSSSLNRSILSGMFSACYLDWLDIAADQASQIGGLFEQIAGQRMTGHERLADGVFRTLYENGTAVTVDYNARAFWAEVVG
jgi:hypothetical protein